MNAFVETFSTPLGAFTVGVSAAGELVATAFGDAAVLQTRVQATGIARDADRTRDARTQVTEYFAGARHTFDLPIAARGSAFQQRVWAALRAIPFGETRTYGQIAAELGNPAASRAVGRANATNPICLVVPCHRVIGRDGSLTGFAFGATIKQWLLEHERDQAFRAA